MKQCVIFGGSGYIGRNLARRLLAAQRFQRILLVDLAPPPPEFLFDGIEFVHHDVRESIAHQRLGIAEPVDWIFHLAAVHREPGHTASEYFRTNLPSVRHITAFADTIGCQRIFFTSSIAVYGPTISPTEEHASLEPVTPYGTSKLCSELILEKWQITGPAKRVVVVRPGVVYGAGDPGNIGRLIRAIAHGRFAFPGRRDIRKSYAYIEGLLDSMEFMLDRDEDHIVYNYVERETLPLDQVVKEISAILGKTPPQLSVPIGLLASTAAALQVVTAGKSPIHPTRVRKAATQTWIVPRTLIEMSFQFRYDFRSSLEHWRSIEPNIFEAKQR